MSTASGDRRGYGGSRRRPITVHRIGKPLPRKNPGRRKGDTIIDGQTVRPSTKVSRTRRVPKWQKA